MFGVPGRLGAKLEKFELGGPCVLVYPALSSPSSSAMEVRKSRSIESQDLIYGEKSTSVFFWKNIFCIFFSEYFVKII